jgi:HK97 family phage prohead protease
VKETKETKSFPFEVKATAEENNIFTFEGYASTFNNIDHGDDVVIRGAFANSLAKNSQVPILWQHQMSEPVGISVQLYEDAQGLFIKGNLPKDDTLVSGRIIPQMKIGSIKEMSIGFFTKNFDMSKDGIRLLKEIELMEVSLVTKAMNSQALVSGFKSFAGTTKLPLAPRDRSWDSTQAEQRIKEYTNSIEAPNQDYRKYFMYFDGQNANLFGSYKLLFTDIINGEPHIIPKAIFSIAGILNGARGGVDITDADKNRIKPVINQLYKRMADEFNDDSITSPLIKSFDTERDIEQTLKSHGFSSTEAKTVISKIKEFSNQRDAGEDNQRDADVKQKIITDLNNFIKNLK